MFGLFGGNKQKKTKEQIAQEELDVRRRAHFVPKKSKPLFEKNDLESVIDDYYASKGRAEANISKNDQLNNYVSVHKGQIKDEQGHDEDDEDILFNMDEDDIEPSQPEKGFENFLHDHLAQLEEDDEPIIRDRRAGFNDELDIDGLRIQGSFRIAPPVKEGGPTNQKPQILEQNLSDDSDQDRGTMAVKLGDDRIKKESKNASLVIVDEQFDDLDEMMDTVGDLDPTKDNENAVHRHSSAFVENTAQHRGMSDEERIEQRLKLMGSQDSNFDRQSEMKRTRAPSMIQLTRQELMRKKIQREQEEPDMRTHRLNDFKRDELVSFLNQEREKATKDDIEFQKQLLVLKDALDEEDSGSNKEEMIDEIFNEQENCLEQLSQDSEEATNFLQEFYNEMNFDDAPGKKDGDQSIAEPDDSELTQDSVDLIKFIDQNERRHQRDAQYYLKKNSLLEFQGQNMLIQQHVITNEENQREITEKLQMERQFNNVKVTAVALTEDLILLGSTAGEVWMFSLETQELYAEFIEKGKEFTNNPITCIAVHPIKSEYVLLGYKGGQIVLFDALDTSKSLKVIKDHHKGSAIANMCFCDWVKQKGKQNQFEILQKADKQDKSEMDDNPFLDATEQTIEEQHQEKQKAVEALQEWMFMSVDKEGRVIINTIQKVMFIFKAYKNVIIEPDKTQSKFYSMDARFRSPLHPQFKLNDLVTLVAIGNYEKILVLAITQSKSQLIKKIERPQFKEVSSAELKYVLDSYPSITWGYGHSPVCKDKCYATLAVGWGPLIQLYVLNNIMDEGGMKFVDDGFHVLNPVQQVKSRTGSLAHEKMHEINPYEAQSKYESLRSSMNFIANAPTLNPFEMPDLYIERIAYLGDSIILVLTRSQEIRILYTQKFDYGTYNPKTYLLEVYRKKKEEEEQKQSFKQGVNIDEGLVVSSMYESEEGQIYRQTIAIYNGIIAAIGPAGLLKFHQLRWDESLHMFKELTKGNWVQEFARAIDIYTGTIKGFRDVPEEQLMRQETMKAELKLFIRMVLIEQLEKWNQEAEGAQSSQLIESVMSENPYEQQEIRQSAPNKQVLKENATRYRTLIRIGIEFCVTIQDCYFLFYDLFLLFQEESLEDIFLDELKPFIMAGRFSDWELPNDILQNHIINYYKDPHQPEQIEKIIINLCLNDCEQSEIVSLIQFAEANFLSTALVYLHSNAFHKKDTEATCIHVILALLDLYCQAKTNNPGSFQELKQIAVLSPDSIERLRAEKSQYYLGYKILWVIRLFLNGKKFPHGNINETQWRNYVREIVDCISKENIMLDLLYIDAEAFFQIVSIIFQKVKVIEFIKKDKKRQDKIIKAQQSMVENAVITYDLYEEVLHQLDHNDILDRFDKVCFSKNEKQEYLVPDEIRMQYLYFVANVASKSSVMKKDSKYYFNCMKELLIHSSKFLKFNQLVMERAIKKKQNNKQRNKQKDQNKHIYFSETALVELLELCEPLDDADVDQLIQMTKTSKFHALRAKLMERKQDYVQQLQLRIEAMKLNSYAATRKEAVDGVFDWINNTLDILAAKKVGATGKETTIKEDALRAQIQLDFSELVNLDAKATFLLIDEKFDHEHEKFLNGLIQNGSHEQQFKYLETMLSTHHAKIQGCIEEYLISGHEKDKAMTYMKLQNMHLRLLCQHHPDKVLERVRRIKKNEVHLTMEDCLEICQEYGQVEACAIFTNKMANYLLSATQYMSLLTSNQHFNYPVLIKQLQKIKKSGLPIPHFHPYPDKTVTAQNKVILRNLEQNLRQAPDVPYLIIRFDYIIRKVMKISIKESTDNFNEETIDKIWFFSLDSIFKIKSQQMKLLETIKNNQIEIAKTTGLLLSEAQAQEDIEEARKKYDEHISNLEEFFKSRIQFIIEHLLKHIELEQFFDHIIQSDSEFMFKELKDMILSIFSETGVEITVLQNANRSANQLSVQSFSNIGSQMSQGILLRHRKCQVCNKYLDEGIKKQKAVEDDNGPVIDPFSELFTLYECGHSFHVKCIERHLEKQQEQAMLTNPNPQKARKQAQKITPKMIESQKCLWCYSDRFAIDFESIFQKSTRRVAANTRIGASTQASEQQDGTGSEDSYGSADAALFDKRRDKTLQIRAQSITKHAKNLQEAKLSNFDNLFFSEAVTKDNFGM